MADEGRAAASTRLDKWLWHARVVRTRTLARKLIGAGKVRVNRSKTTSPSQQVRIGDVLTIALPRAVLVYRIAALAERRGSFLQAQELYVDLSEPQPDGDPPPAATTARRPDARDRKNARSLRGKPD